MPKPPYMNFPFSFYRNYSRIGPNFYNAPYVNTNHNINNSSNPSVSYNSESDEVKEDNRSLSQKNKSNKYTDDYLFDLFGLKIYSDDVLLVSLIYFLYSEGVKDDGLFLVLILLLLS